MVDTKSQIWEQISFCILTTIFLTLSIRNTVQKYITLIRNLRSTSKTKTTVSAKVITQKKILLNGYATFNSAIAYIGFLTETYFYGGRLIINLISITIGYLFTFFILQPFMYDLKNKIKTPYEYLEKRYANRVYCRVIGALVGAFFQFSFSTLFLWSNAVILSTIFETLDLYISIIILGIISILLTLLNGLQQNLILSSIQFILFLFGIIAGLIVTTAGNANFNVNQLWDIAKDNGRLNFITNSGSLNVRYTIWNQLFSLPIPWCAFHGLMVPNFNRYRQIKTKIRSKYFVLSNIPIMGIVNGIIVFCGIFAFTYFYDCDPLASLQIQNKNQIAPYWLIQSLKGTLPSVAGICLASILTYTIIQHSIGLFICVQTIFNDVIKPIFSSKINKFSEFRIHFLNTPITILLSIVSILYAIAFKFSKNSILSLFFLFNNSINSPLLALFLVSMFNPYANHFGTILSFIITLVINFWLGISSQISNLKSQEFPPNTYGCGNMTLANATLSELSPQDPTLYYLYTISSIWYCMFSLLFITIFGSIFSILYALIVHKRIDVDADFKNERNTYIFSFKKHFSLSNFINIKAINKKVFNATNKREITRL